jgi:hypothetical protein
MAVQVIEAQHGDLHAGRPERTATAALKPSASSAAHMGREALRKAQRQPGDKARDWR